jgi:uncharacterized protein YegP (UPF0339 family)
MSKLLWIVGTVFLLASWVGTPGPQPLFFEQLATAGGKDAGLKFEIYEDKAKEFRWRLSAANGEILATAGQGYKAKADCIDGVQRIKKDVGTDKLKFEVYEDKAMEHRWRLKAANGQIVAASSEGYAAKASCEKAIERIRKGAAKAELKE